MGASGVATTDLILASQSPRRKYLLEQAGLTFRVIPSRIDESSLPPTPPADYVRQLAEAKALDVAGAHAGSRAINAIRVQIPRRWVIVSASVSSVPRLPPVAMTSAA